jgi:hypothetical protein
VPTTTLAGRITRTELGLADLVLFGSSPYHLLGGAGNEDSSLQTGQMVRNNRTAESDFLDGAVLVHSRTGMRSLALTMLAYGSTEGDLKAKVETLVEAVSQFSWLLSITINGTEYVWSCWPADFGVAFGSAHIKAYVAQVNLTVPAAPGIF